MRAFTGRSAGGVSTQVSRTVRGTKKEALRVAAELTVAPAGRAAGRSVIPQNAPVSFRYNEDTGTIDIGGYAMGTTRKFANVAATGVASLVIDDVADPVNWKVRGIEIRGNAQALRDVEPPTPYMSHEIVRIHPTRIISWGLDETPGQVS